MSCRQWCYTNCHIYNYKIFTTDKNDDRPTEHLTRDVESRGSNLVSSLLLINNICYTLIKCHSSNEQTPIAELLRVKDLDVQTQRERLYLRG